MWHSRSLDEVGLLSLSIKSMASRVGDMVREIQTRSQALAGFADELARGAAGVREAARRIGTATGEAAADAGRQLELIAGGGEALKKAAEDGDALRKEAGGSAAEARVLRREAEAHVARIQRTGSMLMELRDDCRGLEAAIDGLEAAGAGGRIRRGDRRDRRADEFAGAQRSHRSGARR